MLVPDQIEHRIQENPDNVHEVPIQGGVLDRIVVLGRVSSFPGETSDDPEHRHSNQHMQRMKAREEEIQNKEEFGMPGIRAVPLEVNSRDLMFNPVVMVLVTFYGKKTDAEKHRYQQTPDQQLAIAFTGSMHRERDK